MAGSVSFWYIKDSDGAVVLRDPWVLVLLVAIWTAVAVKSCRDSRHFRRLAKQPLQLATRTSALRLDSADDLDEATDVKKTHHMFFAKPSAQAPGGGEAEAWTEKRVRTWEAFRMREAPPDPGAYGVSFQKQYTTVSRLGIYVSMQKGVVRRCILSVMLSGAVSVTASYWLRTAQEFSDATNTTLFSRGAALGNFQAAAEVMKVLLPLASFILALFINIKLSWYQGIISMSWAIQGQLNDLALTAGAALARCDGEEVMRAKFRLYRYLNLVHFMVYWRVDQSFSKSTLKDLKLSGLVTDAESKILHSAPVARNTVLMWIADLFLEQNEERRLTDLQAHALFGSLTGLRGKIDGFIKELTRVSPLSYVQLMQLMIDVTMLLAPLSLTFLVGGSQTDRSSFTLYLWPAFGSMVLSLFYQGGMRLITVMEQPFGCDLDDLDSDWLLMSSERAIFGYLTASYPPGLQGLDEGAGGDDAVSPATSIKDTVQRIPNATVVEVLDQSGGELSSVVPHPYAPH